MAVLVASAPNFIQIDVSDFLLYFLKVATGSEGRNFLSKINVFFWIVIQLHTDIGNTVEHLLGEAMAIDVGQGRVDINKVPLRAGLENTVQGVFKNAAIVLFGNAQGIKGLLHLLDHCFKEIGQDIGRAYGSEAGTGGDIDTGQRIGDRENQLSEENNATERSRSKNTSGNELLKAQYGDFEIIFSETPEGELFHSSHNNSAGNLDLTRGITPTEEGTAAMC